jgi:hypothetical protein
MLSTMEDDSILNRNLNLSEKCSMLGKSGIRNGLNEIIQNSEDDLNSTEMHSKFESFLWVIFMFWPKCGTGWESHCSSETTCHSDWWSPLSHRSRGFLNQMKIPDVTQSLNGSFRNSKIKLNQMKSLLLDGSNSRNSMVDCCFRWLTNDDNHLWTDSCLPEQWFSHPVSHFGQKMNITQDKL